MTTISRTSQVSHSSVTSGGGGVGGGDWDHRLNNLLHDLQESVVPEEQRKGASEFREYRMTTSSRHNDEPASTTEEKWVEIGTKDGQGYERTPITSFGGATSSSSSARRFESSSEKTVGFTDSGRSYAIDSGLTTGRSPQIEYLTPANTTTILKSGPSSPLGGGDPDTKVDRKEFYSKASYTTLLKGGTGGEFVPESQDRILEQLLPPRDFPPMQPAITSSSSESRESRREVMESRGGTTTGGYRCPAADALAKHQQQTYTATPLTSSKQMSSSYSKDVTTSTMRAITPPAKPMEGLRTPPMVRKILQESTSAHTHTTKPPPSGAPIPIQHTPFYDESSMRSGTQYYNARTTRTETRERDVSPVRRFPSPTPQRREYYGEPPKHLDELLATFDESYTHTSRITGDGGGPHKSHPYGPGTHRVRIDDRVQTRNIIDSETELVQRKTNGSVERSHPVSGPPVFYPQGQLFNRMEEEGKGQSKAKMERKYKAKESSKQKHGEKGGEGAVPVPVCLPVCCAAPCVIQ